MSKIKELLDRGLDVLEQDIGHLESAVKAGPLNYSQSRSLNDGIRTLLSAAKGLKEVKDDEQEVLASLSDEELLELAKQAIEDTNKER